MALHGRTSPIPIYKPYRRQIFSNWCRELRPRTLIQFLEILKVQSGFRYKSKEWNMSIHVLHYLPEICEKMWCPFSLKSRNPLALTVANCHLWLCAHRLTWLTELRSWQICSSQICSGWQTSLKAPWPHDVKQWPIPKHERDAILCNNCNL